MHVLSILKCTSRLIDSSKVGIKDCIEDAFISLNTLAKKHNLTLKECLQAAYDEISGRTGEMVGGIFVKSEDLPKPPYNQGVWTEVTANGAVVGYEGDAEKQGKLV